MGINFRKRIKICKGVYLNLSKKGIGISAGVKGFNVSVNSKGIRRTASIPGTGIYSVKQTSWNSIKKGNKNKEDNIKNNCNNKNIIDNPLPEGVVTPKTPRKIDYLCICSILLLILGFKFILLLPVAFVMCVAVLFMAISSKEYRSALLTQIAINLYKKGYIEKSYKYCTKALKLYENESASVLKESIEASRK
ncbi:MAG: DUF4236 domain-containing protein [Clostridium thermopalmarium]|uniref:DUF4236 domain-containing protein n=1 Tax=Clostridium thermopalmarium TaxID=29373 RepID=UPI00235244CD|nr:DUF4236 domain-containing protein [Clostridium thermopalmarium]MBE6043553.1 DUF4236 domain-containing protein [Clostridium thermopalmarium]